MYYDCYHNINIFNTMIIIIIIIIIIISQHDLNVADFEAKNEISHPTFLTVLGYILLCIVIIIMTNVNLIIGQGMTVIQHFADKRKPISVQLQLKDGVTLEWYYYDNIIIISTTKSML